ncbi:MAG: L,D-transpeptidase, partial [Rhodobiaceae bacterium]|nr:L,D-transpeptidase [Rhodobiaceae bacterium]
VAALFKASGISAPPNAILSVRQNMRPLFSAPVTLRDPDKPLGTHLFTVLDFKPDQQEARWMTVSADDREGVTAADALDRIDIPEATRRTVADLLTSGSSLIVTDRSYFRHTTLGTDFIVETRL